MSSTSSPSPSRLTSTSRRPETATTSPAFSTVSGRRARPVAVAAHALDEQALVAAEPFGRGDGHADDLAALADRVGAQLAGAPGADERWPPWCAARHLALVAGAFVGDVDPEQLRAEEGEDPAGADGAEEIGDGVGDRDQVELGLGLLGRAGRPG